MFNQASSEQSICMVCGTGEADGLAEGLRQELREHIQARVVEGVYVEKGFAAVAVVGEGMRGRFGIAGRFLTALGEAEINVFAITQGASERIISVVVRDMDADRAVQVVHEAFGLHGSGKEEDDGQ
jgi:aspartokinase/homoserine dehydrogenase 1